MASSKTEGATQTRSRPRTATSTQPNKRNAGAAHPKSYFTCPACGATGDHTPNPLGDPRHRVGSLSTKCPGGRECLRGIAEAVGAEPWQILDDAPRWLDGLATGPPRGAGLRAPLPTPAQVLEWHRALVAHADGMAYLCAERGLRLRTVQRHRLGYDGQALVLPVYEHGKLVNVRRRFWPEPRDPKIVGLAGRGSQLYPSPVTPGSTVVLCEGEFDALLARQEGMPARVITTTTGASLPIHLARAFKGCRVAVVYDVGADAATAATLRVLQAVGADEAWAVALPLPDAGQDLTDWFVTHERTADELVSCIRNARKAGRHG